MQQTEGGEFKHIILPVKEIYSIDNLVEETLAATTDRNTLKWNNGQKQKVLNDTSLGMIELVKQITLFPRPTSEQPE